MNSQHSLDPSALAYKLLTFYDQQGRELPWRGEHNLYHIWVSEIMLQQTAVVTVVPYYQRFLHRFPDVRSLAEADEEAVLTQWQGLGYYRRARHLHHAAQLVVHSMAGKIPEILSDLLTLPGIGPSTAAAILAIGRNQHHAILDGNVKRVLSRLIALPHPITSTIAQKQLWSLARILTPNQRPGDYAQAIMDLGAMICTRRNPSCQNCPWNSDCQAYAQGTWENYPLRSSRPAKPQRFQHALMVFDSQNRLLFGKRPSHGVLAGLWEPLSLPMTNQETKPLNPSQLSEIFFQTYHIKTTLPTSWPSVKHTFSHFHLCVYPFSSQWISGQPKLNAYQNFRWVKWQDDMDLPLATLHKKVLARVTGSF